MTVNTRSATTAPSPINPSKRKKPKQKQEWLGYLFVAPAVFLFLMFNTWPLIRGILMAFTNYRFVYPETRWEWNGLENFDRMLADPRVGLALEVTLKYTLFVLPTALIIAFLIAVLISRVEKGAQFYRWLIYLPTILPVAVSFLMFKEILNGQFGLINEFLRAIGVAEPPGWLTDADTALFAIGAAHIWIIIGLPTILFLIAIYNIPKDLYEAAEVDGAAEWHKHVYITMPILKPTFALVFILLLPGIVGVTDPILILNTQGGPQRTTFSIGYHLYQTAFLKGDLRLGYASAISLTISLVLTGITMVVFWWSRAETSILTMIRRGFARLGLGKSS